MSLDLCRLAMISGLVIFTVSSRANCSRQRRKSDFRMFSRLPSLLWA
jgi:hypothetical protein